MDQPPVAARFGVSFGATYLGFATHLGFLRGLIRAGWAPGCVAGSSSGAIVAGLHAAGVSVDAMEALFTRGDLKNHFHEPSLPLRALATFLLRPGFPAVFTGHHLYKLLHGIVGDRQIEECEASKLTIAVANLGANRIELRNRGPLVETMLASCALPGFLAPRRIGPDLLWDGGLGSVVPIEQWLDEPAVTHVAAHAVLHSEAEAARKRAERFNFPGAMLAGHQLASDELMRWKMELLRRAGKRVVSAETVTPRPRLGLPMSLPPPKPWPAHARDLMALGEASVAGVVQQLNGDET